MNETLPVGDSDGASRELARRLGRLLGDARGAVVLAGLQRARGAVEMDADVSVTPAMGNEGVVGIWQRDAMVGGFVRREHFRRDFRFWADVLYIPLKSTKKRVVLVGESVARGYLYDPVFTPARLLEGMLNAVDGPQYEVVDLARTDLSVLSVVPLLQQAALLAPDAVVLWAGNNWLWKGLYTHGEMEEQIGRSGEGYAFTHRLCSETVMPRVTRRVVDTAAEVCAKSGAMGVVVVPEFDLVDWENEPGVILPYLPGEPHVAWMRLRERAIAAIDAGRAGEALGLADEMVGMDEGLSTVSHRLRAQALLLLGRGAEAEDAFVRARDCVCGLSVPASPRCPATVQEAFRLGSRERGLGCVDLPVVFRRELGGGIPDGRLFLDYCHLNVAGLTLAMAEVAASILMEIGGMDGEREAIVERCRAAGTRPTAADEAAAHIAAAVHNAHHGQSYAVMERHALEAMRLDPGIAGAVASLLDVQNRRTQRWMCGKFEGLVGHPIFKRYLLSHSANEVDKFDDHLLSRAFLGASGVAADSFWELMVGEHWIAGGGIDLLEYQYRATTFFSREGATMGPKAGFLTCTEREAAFHFPSDGRQDLSLRLTYRMPNGRLGDGEDCGVLINGQIIAELVFSSHWRDVELRVAATTLFVGNNVISIRWPLQTFGWAAYQEEMVYCLQTGEIPHVLPVYGEVHRCWLSHGLALS